MSAQVQNPDAVLYDTHPLIIRNGQEMTSDGKAIYFVADVKQFKN